MGVAHVIEVIKATQPHNAPEGGWMKSSTEGCTDDNVQLAEDAVLGTARDGVETQGFVPSTWIPVGLETANDLASGEVLPESELMSDEAVREKLKELQQR